MSATIDKAYLKRIREKKLDYFVISRRHHFLDLPKAKFIQIDGFEDKKILSLINDIIEENQNLIIYLPSISKARLFSEYLINKGYLTECIDSKTLDKNRILKMFSKQELRLLVSTTILERGVTFKNLSVMIIEANHRVFETKTLVQISGRVARKSEVGSVYFLSSQISKAMLEANKIIERMNKIPYDM
jgi:competence protein ComFA